MQAIARFRAAARADVSSPKSAVRNGLASASVRADAKRRVGSFIISRHSSFT